MLKIALHWACFQGQTEIVQLIIQNSKMFGIGLNAKDDKGRTALHAACGLHRIVTTLDMIYEKSVVHGIRCTVWCLIMTGTSRFCMLSNS